jgi:hypothetical protein
MQMEKKNIKDIKNGHRFALSIPALFVTVAIFVCQLSMLAQSSGASAQYFNGVSPQLLYCSRRPYAIPTAVFSDRRFSFHSSQRPPDPSTLGVKKSEKSIFTFHFPLSTFLPVAARHRVALDGWFYPTAAA